MRVNSFTIKSRKMSLERVGVKYVRGALGQAAFIKKDDKDLTLSILPSDWSVSQLREIADYMEKNPKCSLFDDGSGELVEK